MRLASTGRTRNHNIHIIEGVNWGLRIEVYHPSSVNLVAGASQMSKASIVIPSDIAAGDYYVLVKVDADEVLSEINENNNVAAAGQTINVVWMFGEFSGRKNVKLTVKDVNGTAVTFALKGGGYGEVKGEASFEEVVLSLTTPKSVLTISTKGKAEVSVGDIISNEPLKGITAKTTDLRGNIIVNGSLDMLTLDDVAEGHTITIGPSANAKAGVLMKFDQISDLAINSEMPIKMLSAAEWLGGSLNAPSVGSITIKGDTKRSISGNLIEVDLILSQKPDPKKLAIGKLSVKSWMESSRILSQGNIGTVTTGAIIDSICFAGVADGITGLPAAEATNFPEMATIKSFAIKGIKTEPSPYYINSNIAAANILSVSIAYPRTKNSGIPFGITADYIKSLKVKTKDGLVSMKNLDEPGDIIEHPPDDIKIRLY